MTSKQERAPHSKTRGYISSSYGFQRDLVCSAYPIHTNGFHCSITHWRIYLARMGCISSNWQFSLWNQSWSMSLVRPSCSNNNLIHAPWLVRVGYDCCLMLWRLPLHAFIKRKTIHLSGRPVAEPVKPKSSSCQPWSRKPAGASPIFLICCRQQMDTMRISQTGNDS